MELLHHTHTAHQQQSKPEDLKMLNFESAFDKSHSGSRDETWDFVLSKVEEHNSGPTGMMDGKKEKSQQDEAKLNEEEDNDTSQSPSSHLDKISNKKRQRRNSNASTCSARSTSSSNISFIGSPHAEIEKKGAKKNHTNTNNRKKSGALAPMVLEEENEGQRLYKTELCRSWEERGYCRYGEKCQFAHGSDELRPLVRHNKYKSELCRYFHVEGCCMYGTRCCFIHTFKKSDVAQVLSQNLFCLQNTSKRLTVFEHIAFEE